MCQLVARCRPQSRSHTAEVQEECEGLLERAYAISAAPDGRLLDLLRQATGMDAAQIGAWFNQRRHRPSAGVAQSLPPASAPLGSRNSEVPAIPDTAYLTQL